MDATNVIAGLDANETFYCSRSNYKEAERWSLSYVFPVLSADTYPGNVNSSNESAGKRNAVVSPALPNTPKSTSSEEYDTLTGFDYLTRHLETLSGKTFQVRPGEESVANDWIITFQVEGGRQPRLHITCRTKTDCVIENFTNHQAVHGRRVG